MIVYFAPLEGVTDVVYRRTHNACFSGVDKYFIPFISPTQNLTFTSREQRAISPAENAGMHAVPQILTKNAEHFLWMAGALADAGYREMNLNMGCPSGTVTAKGKGSGLLRDLGTLRLFLDEIYARSPIPVSLKTRIGFEDASEWPALLEVLKQYPVYELILHPRTRKQFYGGAPHREACRDVLEQVDRPFVYNGDLFTVADCEAFMREYPGTSALMLGRGLISNPALARMVKGGEGLTLAALRDFHDRLLEAYRESWAPNHLIGHMHETMTYMLFCFGNPHKARKALRKAKTLEAYTEAVDRLFGDYPLIENPAFLAEA